MESTVICLNSEAFESLIDKVVGYIKQVHELKEPDEWIPESEAMRLLNVSSKTTLSAWRAQGKILYTQPEKKIILYSRTSISEFLSKHAKHTF